MEKVDVLEGVSKMSEEIKESLSRYKYRVVCRSKGSLDVQLGDADYGGLQVECSVYDEDWNVKDSFKFETLASKEGVFMLYGFDSPSGILKLVDILRKL
ncbi:MAG: hypothetical protein DRJ18_00295 [Candidatus Methanomethylicota archaeon]|nr:MAG: hypothetical protein DRJ18_00295 [Candidatus Verstraetearchaeota archaeon]